MNKLIYILFFLPLFVSAQGNLDNSNPNGNPQAQNVNKVPEHNVLNVDENNAEQVQSPGNDKVQKDNNGKEPYCKECEEIKKLKKEQMAAHTGSGITSGNGKTKHGYFKKFCARASKKWGRAFVKHKKNKPDYSCFNW